MILRHLQKCSTLDRLAGYCTSWYQSLGLETNTECCLHVQTRLVKTNGTTECELSHKFRIAPYRFYILCQLQSHYLHNLHLQVHVGLIRLNPRRRSIQERGQLGCKDIYLFYSGRLCEKLGSLLSQHSSDTTRQMCLPA
jgi:hypothetical protein